jgi:hypothetical protein
MPVVVRTSGVDAPLGWDDDEVPLTLAHPAAVLVLRRTPLPLTALVAGSVVPDLPLILGVNGYVQTHSLWGVLTLDLVLGLVLVAGWYAGIGPAVVDGAPGRWRPPQPTWPPASVRVLLPLAVVVGALTHVVWDAFTHPGRWGTQLVPWLEAEHAGLLGAKWIQYGSGALGTGVVVVVTLMAAAAQDPSVDRVPPRLAGRWYLLALCWVIVAPLLAAARLADEGLHAFLFEGARVGLLSLLVACSVLGLAWRLRSRVGASF